MLNTVDVEMQAHWFFFFWVTKLILGEIKALDILRTMEEKHLTGITLFYYLWEKKTENDLLKLFKRISADIKESPYTAEFNEQFISFQNKDNGRHLFFFLGQELMTTDNWHVLSVGVANLKPMSLWDTMEEIINKGGFGGIDHGGADPNKFFTDISPKREQELRYFCRDFPGKFFIELNGYCIPNLRKFLGIFTNAVGLLYGDCNERMQYIAEEYELPAVASTDLHIWSPSSLKELGSFRIKIPEKDFLFDDPFRSLKRNILYGNFENQMDYVPIRFFVMNYMLPFFGNLVRDEIKVVLQG